MSNACTAYAHELRPGDAFSFDPPRSPSFLVVGREVIGDTLVSLSTLCNGFGSVSNGLMFLDRRDLVYMPTEYPTEHVDNQPIDYAPTGVKCGKCTYLAHDHDDLVEHFQLNHEQWTP